MKHTLTSQRSTTSSGHFTYSTMSAALTSTMSTNTASSTNPAAICPSKGMHWWMISIIVIGCLIAVAALVILAYRMGEVTVLATLEKCPKEERDSVFEKWCLSAGIKTKNRKELRKQSRKSKKRWGGRSWNQFLRAMAWDDCECSN